MHSLTYESDSSTEPLTTVLPACRFVEVVTWKNEEKVRQALRCLSGRMQNFHLVFSVSAPHHEASNVHSVMTVIALFSSVWF